MPRPQDLIGTKAPSFTLPSHTGQDLTFTPGASGCRTVLFFFVAPGAVKCVEQINSMRDILIERLLLNEGSNLQLIGVNTHSLEKLRLFAQSRGIQYPLLSDPDADLARTLYVKSLTTNALGRRATFVIDEQGIIRDVCLTDLAWIRYSKHSDIEKHAAFVKRWTKTNTA